MQELKYLLENEIYSNNKNIQKEISIFERKNLKYRNIELNKNLCLILKNKGNEKLMLIGFPFPLISYPLRKFKAKQETLIFIFLKGPIIRDYQRLSFLESIKDIADTEYNEIDSLKKFREITENLCRKFKKANYYDPYSFQGDSFIGLHFIDNFIKKYNLKLNKIYSENYLSLSIVAKSQGYIGSLEHNKNVLNIFADLIDNQWDRTSYLVKSLTKQSLPSIICGRDLIIVPSKNKINIYHFNRENILLIKENIEDYMNKCLLPFLNPSKNSFKLKEGQSKNIIINPFGSDISKNIPEDIILNLSRHFKNSYPNAKLLLISGFKNSYSHMLWISKLKGLLLEEDIKNIIFRNYGSFEEIKKDILRYNCSLGITADTSIAHLFNFLGLKNITFFNLERCDLKSQQSLSSDSPLGFCRYGNTQYPAIFYGKNKNYLIKGIIQGIDYFIGKNKSLKWTNLIFNKNILVSHIGKDNLDFIDANIKINPRYKLKDD
jgi:hypothetical protein